MVWGCGWLHRPAPSQASPLITLTSATLHHKPTDLSRYGHLTLDSSNYSTFSQYPKIPFPDLEYSILIYTTDKREFSYWFINPIVFYWYKWRLQSWSCFMVARAPSTSSQYYILLHTVGVGIKNWKLSRTENQMLQFLWPYQFLLSRLASFSDHGQWVFLREKLK